MSRSKTEKRLRGSLLNFGKIGKLYGKYQFLVREADYDAEITIICLNSKIHWDVIQLNLIEKPSSKLLLNINIYADISKNQIKFVKCGDYFGNIYTMMIGLKKALKDEENFKYFLAELECQILKLI